MLDLNMPLLTDAGAKDLGRNLGRNLGRDLGRDLGAGATADLLRIVESGTTRLLVGGLLVLGLLHAPRAALRLVGAARGLPPQQGCSRRAHRARLVRL